MMECVSKMMVPSQPLLPGLISQEDMPANCGLSVKKDWTVSGKIVGALEKGNVVCHSPPDPLLPGLFPLPQYLCQPTVWKKDSKDPGEIVLGIPTAVALQSACQCLVRVIVLIDTTVHAGIAMRPEPVGQHPPLQPLVPQLKLRQNVIMITSAAKDIHANTSA